MSNEMHSAIAAEWFAKQQSGAMTSGDRARFLDWLAADDAHRNAWTQVQSTWATMDVMRDESSITQLRAQALANGRSNRTQWLQRPQWPRWQWTAGLAATIVVAVSALWMVRTSPQPKATTTLARYETQIGERATYELVDGSEITLNTDSAVRVSAWGAERHLIIEHGQAFFVVAKDPTKPFVVEAGDAAITALGTQFDVRYEMQHIAVTLSEGRVRLSDHAMSDHAMSDRASTNVIEMNAGSRATMQHQGVWTIGVVDTEKLTSWRDGRVIFDSEPLANVVTELNRYSQTKLAITDKALQSMPISGVFRTGDVLGFANALQVYGVASAVNASEHKIELSPVK